MTDPELLAEILDIQEAISEASTEAAVAQQRSVNDGTTRGKWSSFFIAIYPARIAETVGQLQAAFARRRYDQAYDLTIRLRYWRNIADAISEKPH